MSLLIVKIAAGNSPEICSAIFKLQACTPNHRLIDASAMDIRPCAGCCACMLVTPGQCVIPDDNAQLLKAYLQYDEIVFLVDNALGFIDYKAKNVIDRIFPMVNVLTRFFDGEILHLPRYDINPCVTILYTGDAEQEMLNQWMVRFQKNMTVRIRGAFPIHRTEEVSQWISP